MPLGWFSMAKPACGQPAAGARDRCRVAPFVTTVGLFVNASRCEINEILDAVPLDMLQFHGDESPAQCEGFHRPWYKALRVGGGEDIAAQVALYANASGVLLDTLSPAFLEAQESASIGR